MSEQFSLSKLRLPSNQKPRFLLFLSGLVGFVIVIVIVLISASLQPRMITCLKLRNTLYLGNPGTLGGDGKVRTLECAMTFYRSSAGEDLTIRGAGTVQTYQLTPVSVGQAPVSFQQITYTGSHTIATHINNGGLYNGGFLYSRLLITQAYPISDGVYAIFIYRTYVSRWLLVPSSAVVEHV
jgi:hypothetical protein